jgi:hypothetical protein
MEKIRNSYEISAGKPEERTALGKARRRWIKFPDLFLTRDILLLRYQMSLVVESG